MDNDLISSLTRQIKEEVLEHYLTERRVVELQIEELEVQARDTRRLAEETGMRLTRLVHLAIHPAMRAELLELLKISAPSFWDRCCRQEFTRRVRVIRVRALTDRSRFRKLFVEAYRRLFQWMEKYRQAHASLQGECRAVSLNIRQFQEKFDLLAILSFLKSLDPGLLEQERFLGGNFTPAELASIDRRLYIGQVRFEDFDLPQPLSLTRPEALEATLANLADRIFVKHQTQVKSLLL